MSGDLREPVDYAAVQRLWDSIGWQMQHAQQQPERDRLRKLFGPAKAGGHLGHHA